MGRGGALAALDALRPGGDCWRVWRPGVPCVTLRLADGTGMPCVVALRFGQRLRGLLGSVPADLAGRVLVFPRCASLHTVGMGYALDVALIDGTGMVVRHMRGVRPGRVVGAQGALVALERPASGMPWPVEGEHVAFEVPGSA